MNRNAIKVVIRKIITIHHLRKVILNCNYYERLNLLGFFSSSVITISKLRETMYTIKEAAQKMDISEHSLRFYDKKGLFPFLTRDKNNIRLFSLEDLKLVQLVKCLRSTNLDLAQIKQYIDLCLQGDSTILERYEMIKQQKKVAMMQMEESKYHLQVLEEKEAYYEKLIKKKTEDTCNPKSIQ